ncbi:DnaT-like ssDNA-binding protein [Immundisolibacter sp.]
MASTIVSTVGAADANSYVTLAEAATYMGDRLHKDAWTGASVSERTAALLWAAKLIDSGIDWLGSKTSNTQAMSWPRAYVPNPDPAYATFGYMADDVVPVDIKNAQCEMALASFSPGITAEPGLSSLAVGSLKLDFAGNTQQSSAFPRQVEELLCKYGVVRSAKSSARKLVRT